MLLIIIGARKTRNVFQQVLELDTGSSLLVQNGRSVAAATGRLRICARVDGGNQAGGGGSARSPNANLIAWSRISSGHAAIRPANRRRSSAYRARAASSKPGRSPDIADMK